MKQVIAEEPKSSVVRINEISEKKFYGQENLNYKTKYFIVGKNDNYLALTAAEAIYGNYTSGDPLKSYIERALTTLAHINIYEFDSFEELFEWYVS
jgi:hypothetical protein